MANESVWLVTANNQSNDEEKVLGVFSSEKKAKEFCEEFKKECGKWWYNVYHSKWIVDEEPWWF